MSDLSEQKEKVADPCSSRLLSLPVLWSIDWHPGPLQISTGPRKIEPLAGAVSVFPPCAPGSCQVPWTKVSD